MIRIKCQTEKADGDYIYHNAITFIAVDTKDGQFILQSRANLDPNIPFQHLGIAITQCLEDLSNKIAEHLANKFT